MKSLIWEASSGENSYSGSLFGEFRAYSGSYSGTTLAFWCLFGCKCFLRSSLKHRLLVRQADRWHLRVQPCSSVFVTFLP